MKPRTLKEVAQAGLVLGFEWIAISAHKGTPFLFRARPAKWGFGWVDVDNQSLSVEVIDHNHLTPEKSLLKLSEIVEGRV